MKITPLFAAFLLMLVGSRAVFGQEEKEKAGSIWTGLKPRVGLVVGVNFSSTSFEPEPQGLTKSGRTNVIVGIPLEVTVATAVSVRVEPTFVQYGYTLESDNQFANSSTKARKTYLEFPITGQYNFGDGPISPFGLLGFHLGFLFCSEEEFIYELIGGPEGFGQDSPSTQLAVSADPTDVREFTQKFQFGITFGGGVKYALNEQFSLIGDMRYMLGLTNTSKLPDNVILPPNTPETVTKIRGFQIRVGGMMAL